MSWSVSAGYIFKDLPIKAYSILQNSDLKIQNNISPSVEVKNLGVIFDSDNSFDIRVAKVCRACYYHLRDLRRIRKYLSNETAILLANAMVSSRLDYCNSLLYGISVIGDDVDTIAREVREFSTQFTHVITSGGIGPTHDDLTFQGVADAFGDKVEPHPELVRVCEKYFGTTDLNSPKLKMAFVPTSSELLYGTDQVTGKKKSMYPVVKVSNVYIFPGVPDIMRRAFDIVEEIFHNPEKRVSVRELYIDLDEMSVTPALNQAVKKFERQVSIGSYPEWHNSYYKVKLTVESESEDTMTEVCDFIQSNLPEESVIMYEKHPIQCAGEAVYKLASCDSHMGHKVKHAVEVIEEAMQKYSTESLCVGFNGGKDCTALLHLTYAVYSKKFMKDHRPLPALYIRRGQPFPELELFIKASVQAYNLEIVSVYGRIKEALTALKDSRPQLQAVVMGTRRTDPYSAHLESFSPTDADWPQYMRVSPLLDWSYSDVWTFLRSLNIPYCSLYDRGYTSLGSMENTHPNPALQLVDDKGIISYKPAYLLEDGQSERAGRN